MAENENSQAPESDAGSFEAVYRQGWVLHGAGKDAEAVDAFRKAIPLNPNSVDANYALGLSLKGIQYNHEAIQTFRHVLELIDAGQVEDPTRAELVRRLALGHINQMEKGDWNLEKEIWRKEK
jgi:tetratricopeptide (TPR) repeat protein